jgi:C-terminal processing protease CtpA/Prc
VLTVQTPSEESCLVVVTRRRVTGAALVSYEVLETTAGKRVGYILVTTFVDDTVDDQIERALRAMQDESPLDGLILDNRQNTGGADNVARNTLSFFTGGNQGYFIDRRNHRRGFNIIGGDVAGSAEIPLVVMVGENTVSFGEIFSGVLKDSGRAYLIGEITDGNIELLWGYDFEDGSRVWLAHETFRPRFNPDENWEETGIIPHETVSSNWDEVTTDTDPAIQAAMEYLDEQ